jgi:hypothetical protein
MSIKNILPNLKSMDKIRHIDQGPEENFSAWQLRLRGKPANYFKTVYRKYEAELPFREGNNRQNGSHAVL